MTENEIENIRNKYKNRTELRSSDRNLYNRIKNSVGLDLVFPPKYNKDICKSIALKYKTLKDFRTKDSGAYQYSQRKGYLSEFSWLIYGGKDSPRLVYKYQFQRAVYIGITINLDRRNKEHNTSPHSAVYQYSKNIGEKIPDPIVLENNIIGKNIARSRETFWTNYYKNQTSLKVLNKARPGALGSNFKYTKNSWERLIKNKGYSNINQLRKQDKSLYQVGYRQGWLYTYFNIKKISHKHYSSILEFNILGKLISTIDNTSDFRSINKKEYRGIRNCCLGSKLTYNGKIYFWKENFTEDKLKDRLSKIILGINNTGTVFRYSHGINLLQPFLTPGNIYITKRAKYFYAIDYNKFLTLDQINQL